MKRILLCALAFVVPAIPGGSESVKPMPLVRAHAHNDYEHPHPLTDALEQGFCSIEPDIYLVDGQFLVGHNRSDLRPEWT